jgi:translation initiation factor 2 subunit 3
VQNKIDLVSKEESEENYRQILDFIDNTCAKDSPVIPISAHHETNIDVLISAIEEKIPTPDRDPSKTPIMFTARSFDINKPGGKPDELRGGVIGGMLKQGTLSEGDEIEIRPGRKVEEHGKTRYEAIFTKIDSIFTGGQHVETASPGGLLGIGTLLDPSLTKADSLAGKVVGKEGHLPPVLEQFEMKTHLLSRVVGSEEEKTVDMIKTNESLMLTIGTATTIGVVNSARGDDIELMLKMPVCANTEQKVAISRRLGGRWRLIGYGSIR